MNFGWKGDVSKGNFVICLRTKLGTRKIPYIYLKIIFFVSLLQNHLKLGFPNDFKSFWTEHWYST